MDELETLFEEYKGSRPMNMTKEHIETGVPRWRSIYLKKMPPRLVIKRSSLWRIKIIICAS